ncbi:hypothetical protein CspeluHIS016_0403830 [Cutaneotrichosporon spelunceum]|uniref:Uncharacterized protein n=1 Tax=Cutaneotrichosporon spelunceum TaxID=1672016 RepID=A0AAD3YD55_9TREE|nr:hypothetical protein CspeluHIS016_0403830 [Cutaneotrichosporon spelunceum]
MTKSGMDASTTPQMLLDVNMETGMTEMLLDVTMEAGMTDAYQSYSPVYVPAGYSPAQNVQAQDAQAQDVQVSPKTHGPTNPIMRLFSGPFYTPQYPFNAQDPYSLAYSPTWNTYPSSPLSHTTSLGSAHSASGSTYTPSTSNSASYSSVSPTYGASSTYAAPRRRTDANQPADSRSPWPPCRGTGTGLYRGSE